MVALHTSVDHVGACTGTSAVIVTVRCRSRAASRKTGQTPRRASLRDSGENLLDVVLLDVLNLNILISLIRNEGAKSRYEEKKTYIGVVAKSFHLFVGKAGGKTADNVVDEICVSSNALHTFLDFARDACFHDAALRLFHLDNILASDELDIARDMERRSLGRSGKGYGRETSNENIGTHFGR
jgi:hypothetical protein